MQSRLKFSYPQTGIRGQESQIYNTSKLILPKLPSYGKALIARQKFNNLPFMVVICVGSEAWKNAKAWQQSPNDICALVMSADQQPGQLQWPVSGCLCVIDWSAGPSDQHIVNLVKSLIVAGAVSVTVKPAFVDTSKPAWLYDTSKPIGNRWLQVREKIQIYHPSRKELQRAA